MLSITKRILPILLISSIVVTWVNYSSYQVRLMILRAKFDSIPGDFIFELSIHFITHAALLSVVPLAFALAKMKAASYLALFIVIFMYIGFITGVNLGGPALLIVIIGTAIFFGFRKARDLYNQFRSNKTRENE